MEKTLSVINKMEKEGIIGRYAIGGAVAATKYIEPVQTFDLDIFLIFPLSKSGLISMSPVYDYLSRLGYTAEEEFVNIEGWPVQFLPVYNPLTEEAMEKVIEVEFGETPTRVFSARISGGDYDRNGTSERFRPTDPFF